MDDEIAVKCWLAKAFFGIRNQGAERNGEVVVVDELLALEVDFCHLTTPRLLEAGLRSKDIRGVGAVRKVACRCRTLLGGNSLGIGVTSGSGFPIFCRGADRVANLAQPNLLSPTNPSVSHADKKSDGGVPITMANGLRGPSEASPATWQQPGAEPTVAPLGARGSSVRSIAPCHDGTLQTVR